MTPDPTGGLAQQVRRVTAALSADAPNDGVLLRRFLAERDEDSFTLLVRRHGPMVLGVCRRVAGNLHDADDAFQAAFLVLVRKAAGLAGRDTVGDWLCGVAHRTALKARAVAAKRRVKEAAAARSEADPHAGRDELAEVIDRELASLPAKYREVVVLCELEGRPRREVAGLLGIPEGTLSSRLDTAKKMLADRLTRRGFALPAVLAPAVLVPAELAEAAVRAAAVTLGRAAGSIPPPVLALARRRSSMVVLTQWVAGLTAVVLAVALALGVIHNAPATPGEPMPEPLADEKLEDGVYLLRFEGEGRKVMLADGYEGILGKRLSPSVGTNARLESVSNDNTRYNFYVNRVGPLPPEVTGVQTALVVDGVILHMDRPEKLPADGIVNTRTNVYSVEVARKLGARYNIEPHLRKHPGHRFEVRWAPVKPQYEPGEPVTMRMELKNTGTGPLRFTHGGQQRGPRDNQFRFVAQEGSAGKGLPDTGDPTNFGGITRSITLKPGEVYTAEVDLSKWFTFTGPNTYRITGVFEMPVIDPTGEDGFGPVLWDDLAVGECSVRVVAKKK